ncbi:DNA polymerase III subunit psi [Vibrio sp.]|uniref:DNA polymerase III subunit psi n=1 Tax=Vibrio sp. TaxID=678 RepID=UPI00311F1BCA
MLNNQHMYLHEMGIQAYEMQDIDLLKGYKAKPVSLPETCKLLFVSDKYPTGDDVELFEKVLRSMDLTLAEARHIYPQYISLVSSQSQAWIWFAGCQIEPRIQAKVLSSPSLSSVKGNSRYRRDLWQQICENR